MGVVSAKYPTSIWSGLAADRPNRGIDAAPTGKDYDTLVSEVVALETELFNRDMFNKTNDNAGTLNPGAVVYLKSNGNVDKANAVAVATGHPLGLAVSSIASGASGLVRRAGVLSLTTDQWDAVAGTTGGLTAGTPYYLSDATAGNLTATPPTTATHVSMRVGIALNSTDLLLSCHDAPRLL